MSLTAAAPSPQPSAPVESQPASPAPSQQQQPAPGGAAEPSSTPAAPASAEQSGSPDWRALIAGQDTKALETLSRFKEPGDLWKSYSELRTKLSDRPTIARLDEKATPEQIAEYRKGLGLPEIGKDAKGEDYIKAFKIETPKELSNVERGMIEDYAKAAYEAGQDPRAVKSSVDFFLRQQAANVQAANTLNENLKKEWHGGLRDKLGSKEYDAQLASINAWTASKYADRQDDLANFLHGQLPGGGLVKDHPILFDILSSMAMGDGFTDRIEANSFEASGKSLADQQREIEALRRTDSRKYNEPATQARLEKIIELRIKRGEIDEWGNPVQQRRSA